MSNLSGLKVFVVEDEGPIALLIEDMLLDLGCEVIASAARLDQACKLASTLAIDLAVLDLNLHGSSALPVALVLRERGIPFVFSTGYGSTGLTEDFESYPTLTKPFALDHLRESILLALAKQLQLADRHTALS